MCALQRVHTMCPCMRVRARTSVCVDGIKCVEGTTPAASHPPAFDTVHRGRSMVTPPILAHCPLSSHKVWHTPL